MKKFIYLFLSLLFSYSGQSQNVSIKESWKPLLLQAGLAQYFSGIFESLGIEIEETGEKITILHLTDHFEIKDGIAEDKVDYHIKLKLASIKDMSDFGADGKIDAYESYRIMSVLFTPMTKATLKNQKMNKPFAQKMAHIDNHVHVYLKSPTNDEFVAHTLIFLNKRWIVIDGIHGDAIRTFRMTPDQTIEYQRAVFKAQKENTPKSWKKFRKFYVKWRKAVSVKND